MAEPGFSPVKEESARALAGVIPDTEERLEAVDWLFQADPRAPYALVLEQLTGSKVPPERAASAWFFALELQHRWADGLHEPVTLRAAAAEAVARCLALDSLEQGLPQAESGAGSLRNYLERDLLTGLYHRLHYDLDLPSQIKNASRKGQPVSLLLMDLDGIGKLNRTLGHATVDDLLRAVGQIVREHFRPSDVPCRFGGDEFAVILPGTPLAAVRGLADELLTKITALREDSVLTASIGISSYPEDASQAAPLHRAAVAALRYARSQGGGRVAAYFFDHLHFSAGDRASALVDTEPPDEASQPGPGLNRGFPTLEWRRFALPGFAVVAAVLAIGLGVHSLYADGRSNHSPVQRLTSLPPKLTAGAADSGTGSDSSATNSSAADGTHLLSGSSQPGNSPTPPTGSGSPAATTSSISPSAQSSAAGNLPASGQTALPSASATTGQTAPGGENAALSPSAPLDPLRVAASPRAHGDYSLAVRQLEELAGASKMAAPRLQAEIAAAAAEGANGKDPGPRLNAAASQAKQTPPEVRPDLLARAQLVDARWALRHGNRARGVAEISNLLHNPCSALLRTEAGALLLQTYNDAGQQWPAWSLANSLAKEQSDPIFKATYTVLAADALNHGEEVLTGIRNQPELLSASGPLAEPLHTAVAYALLPPSRTSLAPEVQHAQLFLQKYQLPAGAMASLRIALANRLLDLGDMGDAQAMLEPVLPAASAASSDLAVGDRLKALFLGGMTSWYRGDVNAAQQNWKAVVEQGKQADRIFVWIPAPDEQWWTRSAALLLGQEAPADYHYYLSLEGQPRAQDGKYYLQMISHPQAKTSTSAAGPGAATGPGDATGPGSSHHA